ncbi:alpha/beta fold hydrolase [Flavilitoribacter nigricans]|nr:alpha/beta hydrolase [Flavilitoribacter nigricans]
MKTSFIFLIILTGFTSLFAQPEKKPSMQDWQYPYDVHYAVLSDSIEVAYVDEGKGDRTLLFIHGLGSYLRAWDQNIAKLKKRYRCIALDLPGYGKSSKGAYAYDMSFFAHTVRQFIDALGLENVVLVGHSMGGQIALHTVLQDPEGIDRLVLLAPAGFETFTAEESAWMKNVYNAALIKATPAEQIVKNFEINFFEMPDNARFMIDDRMYMRETVEYDRYCEMVPRCVKGMLNEPVFDRLSGIDLPTLIIYGQEDRLIPNPFLHAGLNTETVARSGHDAMPNSTLLLLPEAGHFVQWEQAKAVNKALRKFLK